MLQTEPAAGFSCAFGGVFGGWVFTPSFTFKCTPTFPLSLGKAWSKSVFLWLILKFLGMGFVGEA